MARVSSFIPYAIGNHYVYVTRASRRLQRQIPVSGNLPLDRVPLSRLTCDLAPSSGGLTENWCLSAFSRPTAVSPTPHRLTWRLRHLGRLPSAVCRQPSSRAMSP